jgi:hypothetical protein
MNDGLALCLPPVIRRFQVGEAFVSFVDVAAVSAGSPMKTLNRRQSNARAVDLACRRSSPR